MTITVSLPPDLEVMVHAKIEAGLYNSPGEMVSIALHLLDDHDQFRQMKLKKLRAEIRKGEESGPGIPEEEVFKRIEARIRAVEQRQNLESQTS